MKRCAVAVIGPKERGRNVVFVTDMQSPPLTTWACQVANGSDARYKKVSAAQNGYKSWKAGYSLPHGLCLHSKCASPWMVSADDWIGIVIERIKIRVADPSVLNEFKLTSDIGAEANEVEPSILFLSSWWIGVKQVVWIDRLSILAPTTKDAVPLAYSDGLLGTRLRIQ